MNKEEMKAEITKLREANEHLMNNINKLANTMYEDMYSKNMAHTKQLIKELEADIEPTPVKPEKYDVELEYDYEDPRTEFEDFDWEDFKADEDTILNAVKRAIRNNHYPRVGEMINGDSNFYEITQIIYYGGPNAGTGIRYYVRYDKEATNP